MRPPYPAHQCPAPGCTAIVADGYVGCRTHWLRLPRHTRDALADVFRRRVQDPAAFGQARRQAERLVGAL